MAAESDTFVVAGVAVDKTGRTLLVAGVLGNRVSVVDGIDQDPATFRHIALPEQSHPYAVVPLPDGPHALVSLWGAASVALIDHVAGHVQQIWPTEAHRTEMVLSPDGSRLFVACANSTKVSVLDTRTGRSLETLHCALYPVRQSGNTPNSLALSADGSILWVANADNNNFCVFQVAEAGRSKPLGFIPVGWYPTSVRFDYKRRRIYVVNGKGITPLPNIRGPQPGLLAAATAQQYIARLFRGTLSTIELPTPETMAEYTRQAYACSPLREDLAPPRHVQRVIRFPAKSGIQVPSSTAFIS